MARAYYAPMMATVIRLDKPGGNKSVERHFYPKAIIREKVKGWQSTVIQTFVEELADFVAAAKGAPHSGRLAVAQRRAARGADRPRHVRERVQPRLRPASGAALIESGRVAWPARDISGQLTGGPACLGDEDRRQPAQAREAQALVAPGVAHDPRGPDEGQGSRQTERRPLATGEEFAPRRRRVRGGSDGRNSRRSGTGAT